MHFHRFTPHTWDKQPSSTRTAGAKEMELEQRRFFVVMSNVLSYGPAPLPERPGECHALFSENPKRRDRLARRGERLKL
jgi:hypothetical protein